MTEQSNTPTTHEELSIQLNDAIAAGKQDDIDRLMAVEIPDEPEVQDDEPEEIEDVKADEATDDVTKDEPSDEVDEEKDEAATDSAASKPEDTVKDEPAEDEVTRLRKELHALKSDAGRVPFLQRRLQELDRELRDAKLSRKVTEVTTDTTASGELPEALKTKIEKLRDIDPDLADILETGFKSQSKVREDAAKVAADMVKEYTAQQDTASEQEFIQQQYSKLVEKVPYAPQVFQSKEWKAWKETLLPNQRGMAESVYADEVALAIGAFVQEMQTRHGGATKQPAAEQSTQVEDTKTSEAVTKVQESRERKLNAETGTGKPTAKGPKPKMTDEELFEAEYNRIMKENHFVR